VTCALTGLGAWFFLARADALVRKQYTELQTWARAMFWPWVMLSYQRLIFCPHNYLTYISSNFQQGNATAHTSQHSMEALHEMFCERIISWWLWLPRLTDLSVCDFYVWENLKQEAQRNNPHTLVPYNTPWLMHWLWLGKVMLQVLLNCGSLRLEPHCIFSIIKNQNGNQI
jgi:hypothetical protein